jgi:hypothetical protein
MVSAVMWRCICCIRTTNFTTFELSGDPSARGQSAAIASMPDPKSTCAVNAFVAATDSGFFFVPCNTILCSVPHSLGSSCALVHFVTCLRCKGLGNCQCGTCMPAYRHQASNTLSLHSFPPSHCSPLIAPIPLPPSHYPPLSAPLSL